jgi:hypothetical protein
MTFLRTSNATAFYIFLPNSERSTKQFDEMKIVGVQTSPGDLSTFHWTSLLMMEKQIRKLATLDQGQARVIL